MLGCAEVMASVGFVPTKVGTYQSGVMAPVGFVPTKVGTYQSGVMASVGFVPTKVGTYQSSVVASVGLVPTKVGTYPRLRLSPVRTQADVAFDDAALLVAVAAQFARVVGHGIGADRSVETPDHTHAGFQRA